MTVTLGTSAAAARKASMQVRKRNGDSEPVDVNKTVRAVERWASDLDEVDPFRVATKTISGLYDGATTAELDRLSIRTSAEMITEEHGRRPSVAPWGGLIVVRQFRPRPTMPIPPPDHSMLPRPASRAALAPRPNRPWRAPVEHRR